MNDALNYQYVNDISLTAKMDSLENAKNILSACSILAGIEVVQDYIYFAKDSSRSAYIKHLVFSCLFPVKKPTYSISFGASALFPLGSVLGNQLHHACRVYNFKVYFHIDICAQMFKHLSVLNLVDTGFWFVGSSERVFIFVYSVGFRLSTFLDVVVQILNIGYRPGFAFYRLTKEFGNQIDQKHNSGKELNTLTQQLQCINDRFACQTAQINQNCNDELNLCSEDVKRRLNEIDLDLRLLFQTDNDFITSVKDNYSDILKIYNSVVNKNIPDSSINNDYYCCDTLKEVAKELKESKDMLSVIPSSANVAAIRNWKTITNKLDLHQKAIPLYMQKKRIKDAADVRKNDIEECSKDRLDSLKSTNNASMLENVDEREYYSQRHEYMSRSTSDKMDHGISNRLFSGVYITFNLSMLFNLMRFKLQQFN